MKVFQFNFQQICIDDPSKTFWDDPKMYVDDPGLETLLSLTTEDLLLCNNQDLTTVAIQNESDSKNTNSKIEQQLDKINDGKQALVCMYPNCEKSYLKPSHLKASKYCISLKNIYEHPSRSVYLFYIFIVAC